MVSHCHGWVLFGRVPDHKVLLRLAIFAGFDDNYDVPHRELDFTNSDCMSPWKCQLCA